MTASDYVATLKPAMLPRIIYMMWHMFVLTTDDRQNRLLYAFVHVHGVTSAMALSRGHSQVFDVTLKIWDKRVL